MAKLIPLTRGKLAIVDDDAFADLSLHKWTFQASDTCVRGEGYAFRYSEGGALRRRRIFMHDVILPPPTGKKVDHISGNTLDNRRDNLRHATRSQNAVNRPLASNNTSGYRGVSFHKGKGRWRASIKQDGRAIYLGSFSDKEDAARAYNEAALRLFGEFAILNEVRSLRMRFAG